MKVLFVGIGSIAKRHIANLKEVCGKRGISVEIDALRRTNLPFEGVQHIYTSVLDLPKDYDLIFLTNPTSLHASMLLELKAYGKHFFIEKPVASLETADLLKNFETNDGVYYVAGPLRYNAVITYLKEHLKIEDVLSVRSICSSYLPEWREGVDYRETYSAHKELGGGVSVDLIHEWDYLTYLFGMPTEVLCLLGHVSPLEIDSDDYALYLGRYPKMVVELHLDYFGRQSRREMEIMTKDETIVADILAGKITYLRSSQVVELSEERNAWQQKELNYFLDLVEGKKEDKNNFAHALELLNLTQGSL